MISAKKKFFLCLSLIAVSFYSLINFHFPNVKSGKKSSLNITSDFQQPQDICFNIIKNAKIDLSWICNTTLNLEHSMNDFKFTQNEKELMSETGKVLFLHQKMKINPENANRTCKILIWNHGKHLERRQV